MFNKSNHELLNKLLLVLLIVPMTVFGGYLQEQRNLFLKAEKLLQQGNTPVFLTNLKLLTDYPLYPYLQFQWLKNQLQDTENIKNFIKEHPNNYYTELLRKKWLNYLAKQQRWHEFVQFYQADDNKVRECQFYWAQFKTGNHASALLGAKRLWIAGNVQANECDPLFSTLILSPFFDRDLIWQRFEWAITNDNFRLAKSLRRLLPASEQEIADLWLKVAQKTALILNKDFLPLKNKHSGRIFAFGINKIAQSNLDLAITAWDNRNQALTIDWQNIQQTERTLALALAYQHDKRAYDRFKRLSINDDKINEWKIRSALWDQNWQHVSEALAGLSAAQRRQPVWQYWQARCFEAIGDKISAQTLYRKLAKDRSFYGFLAADLIGKPYQLADRPTFITENQSATLAAKTDFRAIEELKFFNRDLDVRRLWVFTTNKLDKELLKAAAKLAQQWQWDQLAIITLAKADYWDDIALRFPIRHSEQIRKNTNQLDIDPAIIFALIRQESMFHNEAVSPTGAKGLMQVMPSTAKFIAGKLGEPWLSDSDLFNSDINIRYGSSYFKQLLERFNNHFSLAIAAYNAGPNRIAKWLPAAQTIPTDIWIETIPYEETRKYVTAVFFYTIIYQLRIEGNTLQLKNLLHTIELG